MGKSPSCFIAIHRRFSPNSMPNQANFETQSDSNTQQMKRNHRL